MLSRSDLLRPSKSSLQDAAVILDRAALGHGETTPEDYPLPVMNESQNGSRTKPFPAHSRPVSSAREVALMRSSGSASLLSHSLIQLDMNRRCLALFILAHVKGDMRERYFNVPSVKHLLQPAVELSSHTPL